MSRPCTVRVRPRRRARSWSVYAPSGCRQSVSVGLLGQGVGPKLGGQPGQLGSAFSRVCTSTAGQLAKKVRITCTWLAPIFAVAWAAAVGGQQRQQRFAGLRAARPEVGGLVHPPVGLLAGDPQPVGQRAGSLAPNSRGVGSRGQLIDQRMWDGQQAPHVSAPDMLNRSGAVSTSNDNSTPDPGRRRARRGPPGSPHGYSNTYSNTM